MNILVDRYVQHVAQNLPETERADIEKSCARKFKTSSTIALAPRRPRPRSPVC